MLSVEKSRASRMSLHLNYEIVPQLYTYERKSLRLCNEHGIFGYHHTMRKHQEGTYILIIRGVLAGVSSAFGDLVGKFRFNDFRWYMTEDSMTEESKKKY